MCLLLFKNLLRDAADRHLTIAFHSSLSCLTLHLQKIEKKKKKKSRGLEMRSQMRSPSITSDVVQNSSRGATGEANALNCTHHSSSTSARKSLLFLALTQRKPHGTHQQCLRKWETQMQVSKKKKKEWQVYYTDTLLPS